MCGSTILNFMKLIKWSFKNSIKKTRNFFKVKITFSEKSKFFVKVTTELIQFIFRPVKCPIVLSSGTIQLTNISHTLWIMGINMPWIWILQSFSLNFPNFNFSLWNLFYKLLRCLGWEIEVQSFLRIYDSSDYDSFWNVWLLMSMKVFKSWS